FLANLMHQQRVDLEIEEGVHLQHLIGKHHTIGADLVLQQFHGGAPASRESRAFSPIPRFATSAGCISTSLFAPLPPHIGPKVIYKFLFILFLIYPPSA